MVLCSHLTSTQPFASYQPTASLCVCVFVFVTVQWKSWALICATHKPIGFHGISFLLLLQFTPFLLFAVVNAFAFDVFFISFCCCCCAFKSGILHVARILVYHPLLLQWLCAASGTISLQQFFDGAIHLDERARDAHKIYHTSCLLCFVIHCH